MEEGKSKMEDVTQIAQISQNYAIPSSLDSIYDLYIFNLPKNSLPNVRTKTFECHNIKLVTFETVFQNLTSNQEVKVCLLVCIEINKYVNITF